MVSRLLMMMSIEIASVLSHRVSQETVNTREQLKSTLIRMTTVPNTDRCRYSCDVIKTVQATRGHPQHGHAGPGSSNYTLRGIRGI